MRNRRLYRPMSSRSKAGWRGPSTTLSTEVQLRPGTADAPRTAQCTEAKADVTLSLTCAERKFKRGRTQSSTLQRGLKVRWGWQLPLPEVFSEDTRAPVALRCDVEKLLDKKKACQAHLNGGIWAETIDCSARWQGALEGRL